MSSPGNGPIENNNIPPQQQIDINDPQKPVDKKVNKCIVFLFEFVGAALLAAGAYFIFKGFYDSGALSDRTVKILRGTGISLAALGLILCLCGVREYKKGSSKNPELPQTPELSAEQKRLEAQQKAEQKAVEKKRAAEQTERDSIRRTLLKAVSASKISITMKPEKISVALEQLAGLTLAECPIEKRIALYRAILGTAGVTDSQRAEAVNGIVAYIGQEGVQAFIEEQVTSAVFRMAIMNRESVWQELSEARKGEIIQSCIADHELLFQLPVVVRGAIYNVMTPEQMNELSPERKELMSADFICNPALLLSFAPEKRQAIYGMMTPEHTRGFILSLDPANSVHFREVASNIGLLTKQAGEERLAFFFNGFIDAQNPNSIDWAGRMFVAFANAIKGASDPADILYPRFQALYNFVYSQGSDCEVQFVTQFIVNPCIKLLAYIDEFGVGREMVLQRGEEKPHAERIRGYLEDKIFEITKVKVGVHLEKARLAARQQPQQQQ